MKAEMERLYRGIWADGCANISVQQPVGPNQMIIDLTSRPDICPGLCPGSPDAIAARVLADCLGAEEARRHFKAFAAEVIAGFEHGGWPWDLTESEIKAWHDRVHTQGAAT